MKKFVEEGSAADAANHEEEITFLRNQVEHLKKEVSLLYRDMEHICMMCSTVNHYLSPARDGFLLDGDELRSVIHLIGIISCEFEQRGCE